MNISENNLNIATQLFLGNPNPLLKKDQDFQNLFLSYISDSNSSTIRELVTLHILGYQPYHEKHGADGIDNTTGKLKEVKPKFLYEGKLSNTGNFNDMTFDLLEKKKDFDIVCSLFSRDRLIYIVEFPLQLIYDVLKKPIINAVAGRRVVCHFNYKNYDDDLLKVYYLDVEVCKQRKCLSNPHLQMLEKRYNAIK